MRLIRRIWCSPGAPRSVLGLFSCVESGSSRDLGTGSLN
uniref:Uncharacterized protein n=1 Tax=Arundo donax TaxID=35708 RepID=A0A0A8ZM65_ARUDO